ncbi:hypothetical protein SprV_0902655800 [Sparganum proliferum]
MTCLIFTVYQGLSEYWVLAMMANGLVDCPTMFTPTVQADRITACIINTMRPDGLETTYNAEFPGGVRSRLVAKCGSLLIRLPMAIFYIVIFLLSLGFFLMVFSMITEDVDVTDNARSTMQVFDWGLVAFAAASILLVFCVIIQCILKFPIFKPTSSVTPPPSPDASWCLPPN